MQSGVNVDTLLGALEQQYQTEGMGAEIEENKSENLEFSEMSMKGKSMTLRN